MPNGSFVYNSGEFKAKHKNVYEYEVLGGLHSLICKNQLATEHPDNPYYTVALADVYVGLSDEESLRLASRHRILFTGSHTAIWSVTL